MTSGLVIHACIGQGGYGEVYRATMTSSAGFKKEVALKVLRDAVKPDDNALLRLKDEARLLGRLNHRNILGIHDMVVVDGKVGLIAEYIDGEDLREIIYGDRPMPLRPLLEVVAEVASALHAAYHSTSSSGEPLRLVHRDIKPANIRISKTGAVKVMDFGIAHSSNMAREAKTKTGELVGTLTYVAPERLVDDAPVPAVDVFALGCVLYEGIARRPWVKGTHQRRVVKMAFDEDLFNSYVEEQLFRIQSECPISVLKLLRDMLSYRPELRPSELELEQRCETLADDSDGPSMMQWCRRRQWAESRTFKGHWVGRNVDRTRSLLHASLSASAAYSLDSMDAAVDSMDAAVDSMDAAVDSMDVAVDSMDVAVDSMGAVVDARLGVAGSAEAGAEAMPETVRLSRDELLKRGFDEGDLDDSGEHPVAAPQEQRVPPKMTSEEVNPPSLVSAELPVVPRDGQREETQEQGERSFAERPEAQGRLALVLLVGVAILLTSFILLNVLALVAAGLGLLFFA